MSVATSKPLSGGPNALGTTGEDAAAYLVAPLGWAAVVFLFAWFVMSGLFVVNRSVGRLALRASGWAVLVACAATAADWAGPKLPAGAVAGRGPIVTVARVASWCTA